MEIGTFTNGLYKVYGILTKEYLYGVVVYSSYSVCRKWEFIKSYKYHLETDKKPQWYKLTKKQ